MGQSLETHVDRGVLPFHHMVVVRLPLELLAIGTAVGNLVLDGLPLDQTTALG